MQRLLNQVPINIIIIIGVAAEADCKACDVGTYKTERGSAECISCTANSTTLTLASTDPSNCACSVGFSTSHACRILFAEECICTECPVNYYGSHLSLDCLPCPDNTHSLAASTDATCSMCKCLPGFQQVDTKPNTDIPTFAPFALLARSGRRQVAYSVQSIQAQQHLAL